MENLDNNIGKYFHFKYSQLPGLNVEDVYMYVISESSPNMFIVVQVRLGENGKTSFHITDYKKFRTSIQYRSSHFHEIDRNTFLAVLDEVGRYYTDLANIDYK